MRCARCGRVIKTNNHHKIGNYFYGSTCARKLFGKNIKVNKIPDKTDADLQQQLF